MEATGKTTISAETVMDKIKEFLREETRVQESEVTNEAKLYNDLGLDSMDRAYLCVFLEDTFDVRSDVRSDEELTIAELVQRMVAAAK